jgi:hypothetical protein
MNEGIEGDIIGTGKVRFALAALQQTHNVLLFKYQNYQLRLLILRRGRWRWRWWWRSEGKTVR